MLRIPGLADVREDREKWADTRFVLQTKLTGLPNESTDKEEGPRRASLGLD